MRGWFVGYVFRCVSAIASAAASPPRRWFVRVDSPPSADTAVLPVLPFLPDGGQAGLRSAQQQRRLARLVMLRRHHNDTAVALPDLSAALGGIERASRMQKLQLQRCQPGFPPVISAEDLHSNG